MKYIILSSLLSSAAFAAPFAQQQQQQAAGNPNVPAGAAAPGTQPAAAGPAGQNAPQQGANTANGQTPTPADLATAVSNWQADTSMVSNFLNTGGAIQNNVAFKQAATVAFNAEVDELNHKAIIDAANSADPNVIAANSTLATGGAFQDVVDKLQEMSVKGRAAVQNIDLINQNRCTNVLPNIDAYMASTGSTSQAIRPQACDQTGVINGVQSNGPTLPGGTPGTPQAAFAAAQSLAAGTGNGNVNTPQAGVAPGQAAQGQQGQVPQGQAQGQVPQGQVQGQTPQGQAQGQVPQGQAQGQVPQGQAQGQTPQGQAQGQAQQGQLQGQGQAQRGQAQQGQAQQGQAQQGQAQQGQAQQGQAQQGQAQQGQAQQGQAQQGQAQQGQAQQGQAQQGQAQQAGAGAQQQQGAQDAQ